MGTVGIFIKIGSAVFLASLISWMIYFLFKRNGHGEHAKTTYDGVDECVMININGVNKELSVRGYHHRNPIILFLDGDITNQSYRWQPYLEAHYTFVTYKSESYHQEQNDQLKNKTDVEELLSQIDIVVERLKVHFNQEKIILMGHSYGTIIGSQYAYKKPENILAYVGVGQFVHSHSSETIAFNEALARANAQGDKKYINELIHSYMEWNDEKTDLNHSFMRYKALLQKYLKANVEIIGGKQLAIHFAHDEQSSNKAEVTPILTRPILNSKDVDMRKYLDYQLPVYFINGGCDYETSSLLSREYMDLISAPKKEMVLMGGLGHSPHLDDSQYFATIVKRLLAST